MIYGLCAVWPHVRTFSQINVAWAQTARDTQGKEFEKKKRNTSKKRKKNLQKNIL